MPPAKVMRASEPTTHGPHTPTTPAYILAYIDKLTHSLTLSKRACVQVTHTHTNKQWCVQGKSSIQQSTLHLSHSYTHTHIFTHTHTTIKQGVRTGQVLCPAEHSASVSHIHTHINSHTHTIKQGMRPGKKKFCVQQSPQRIYHTRQPHLHTFLHT